MHRLGRLVGCDASKVALQHPRVIVPESRVAQEAGASTKVGPVQTWVLRSGARRSECLGTQRTPQGLLTSAPAWTAHPQYRCLHAAKDMGKKLGIGRRAQKSGLVRWPAAATPLPPPPRWPTASRAGAGHLHRAHTCSATHPKARRALGRAWLERRWAAEPYWVKIGADISCPRVIRRTRRPPNFAECNA